MTMKITTLLVVLASTLFLSLISPMSLAVEANGISAPVILDADLGPGSTLTLAINVTNIGPVPEDMDGWQVQLQLDPSVLRILNVRDGPVLDDVADALGGFTLDATQFNVTAGTVAANELLILPGSPPQPADLGFTGSGDLVYIDVEVQAYGNSSISFNTSLTYFRDIDGPDIINIDYEVRNGFFANVPVVLPPIASFTIAPDRPFAGTNATFDASESYDIDGTIVQYSWDFGDGAQSNETDPVAFHTYATFGPYNVTLTVTDDDGATAVATRILFVGGQNLPPVAVFTFTPPDPEVFEPVTFNATGSYDPEGRLRLQPYVWDFGDGFLGGGLVVQHAYGQAGNYTVVLTVVDDRNQRGTAEQQVTVREGPPNEPPVPIFTFDPANPHVGETVRFDATSSFDPDGSIIDYTWTFGDGGFGVPGQIVFHTFFSPGTFTVTLTVRDNRGQFASASSQITVAPRPEHDVGIDDIIVSRSRLVSGQFAVVTVIVENVGSHDENVTVSAYYDGILIGSVTQRVFGSPFYVYYAYITIFWDTSGVPPGEYTISADAQIVLDEDSSNNAFTNGQVTILPPPRLDPSPLGGPVATRVTVTGTGLPENPFPQGPPRPILVSFDNQFLGYTFTTGNEFVFIFSVPEAEPGVHKINVLDVLTLLRISADFTVVDKAILEVGVDVGSLYFEGDMTIATVQVQRNGHLVDPTSIQATLMLPDGTSQTLSLRKVEGTMGLYRIEIAIASRNSVGTYNINVEASYDSDYSDSTGHALKSFTVKTAWLSPTRIRTMSVIGSLASVGLVGPILFFKTFLDKKPRRKGQNVDAPPTYTSPSGSDAM